MKEDYWEYNIDVITKILSKINFFSFNFFNFFYLIFQKLKNFLTNFIKNFGKIKNKCYIY